MEEDAAEVDRTIETAAAKVKANHMASVLVTHSMTSHEQQSLPCPSDFQAAVLDKQKDHQKHADQSESSA